MGLLDTLESMAGQNQSTQVAGSLIQEIQAHPGGLGGILDRFRNSGLDQPVNQWATGESQMATPEQVQAGLGGTGIIDRIAARVGVSPETATVALSTILPLVIQHFTNQQAQPLPQNNYGSLAANVLGRLL